MVLLRQSGAEVCVLFISAPRLHVTDCPADTDPTMSSALWPTLLLLLGLSWAGLGSSSCRVQIPPHDQVARVARFIAHQCDWASMATISSHKPVEGQPFSNVFSVSDGPQGTSSGVPYMYLTHMEVSVQDLQVNGRSRFCYTNKRHVTLGSGMTQQVL